MPPQGPEPPAFLASPVVFSDGTVFTPLHPLTDYRTCHEGHPHEARIVYTCQPQTTPATPPPPSTNEDYILKIKVQVPGPNSAAAATGPSDTTALERTALQKFRDVDASFAPQLRGFETAVQGDDGPLPGGYVTYSLMTKMRGETLFDSGFWGRGEAEREEIVAKFLEALRNVYELGIRPQDRALRNVMWDEETRTCSIIDFEMWTPTDGAVPDETKELQRWGLARSPPQKWWDIWFEAECG